MGIVGKIKKAIKKHKIAASLAHPAGAAYVLGEKARRRFERKTQLGRTIKAIYNPQRSPSSINSAGAAIPGHVGSNRSISSMM